MANLDDQKVIDVILGEAASVARVGPEKAYQDMLAIASVIANRSNQLGVPPRDVVSVKSEFNAQKPSPGMSAYRDMALQAVQQVMQSGPVHNATFYATPSAKTNLPSGLTRETTTAGHVFYSDPQNRSIRTAGGFKSPTNTAAANDVRQIQQQLNALGFNVAVDGKMGRQTKDAIATFQAAADGLTVDGVAGPQTKAALSQYASAVSSQPVTTATTFDPRNSGTWNTTANRTKAAVSQLDRQVADMQSRAATARPNSEFSYEQARAKQDAMLQNPNATRIGDMGNIELTITNGQIRATPVNRNSFSDLMEAAKINTPAFFGGKLATRAATNETTATLSPKAPTTRDWSPIDVETGYMRDYGPKRPSDPKQNVMDFTKAAVGAHFGPGYSVKGISGRGNYGGPEHRTGSALDFDVIDPMGRKVTDKESMYGLAETMARMNPAVSIGYSQSGYMNAGRMHVGLANRGRQWGVDGSILGMDPALSSRITAARQEALNRPAPIPTPAPRQAIAQATIVPQPVPRAAPVAQMQSRAAQRTTLPNAPVRTASVQPVPSFSSAKGVADARSRALSNIAQSPSLAIGSRVEPRSVATVPSQAQKMAAAYGQYASSRMAAPQAPVAASVAPPVAAKGPPLGTMTSAPAVAPAVAARPIAAASMAQARPAAPAPNMNVRDPRTGLTGRQAASLDAEIASLLSTQTKPQQATTANNRFSLGNMPGRVAGAVVGNMVAGPIGGIIGGLIGGGGLPKADGLNLPSMGNPFGGGSIGSNYQGGWTPAAGGNMRSTEPIGVGMGGDKLIGVQNQYGATSMLGDGGSQTYGGPGGNSGK